MTDDLNPTSFKEMTDLGLDDEPQVDYVGEASKKFRTSEGRLDVEALARGKWESDNKHIPQIEAENRDLRQELATRSTLEQILAKIESQKAAVSNLGNQSMDEDNEPSVPHQTVEQLVRQTLEQEKLRSQKADNISYANNELSKVWGSGHSVKVSQKAAELGVSPDFLETMKSTHPKAFLRLVLDQPKGDPNASAPPRSQVTGLSNVTSNVKNYRYWQKLRRENPGLYRSVEACRERETLAAQMGEDFYR